MAELGCPPPNFIPGKENSHFLVVLKINSEWGDKAVDNFGPSVTLSNAQQLVLESCLSNTLTFKELSKAVSIAINKSELENAIRTLKGQGYLIEKNIRQAMGLIKTRLFLTTDKGKDALKKSF